MKLTTLGTGTTALSATRVRAGHLIEADDVRLLIDCGSGVTLRLAERGDDWLRITHIAITHFHADHISDIPTLIDAWKYGTLPPRSAPLQIIAPAGFPPILEAMAAAFGGWVTAPGFPVTLTEIAPGGRIRLGAGVEIEAFKVPHTEESVAYSITHDGRRMVYTGDTGYDEPLARWAHECDLLLCECSLPPSLAIPIHLTPEQCGAMAAIASPRRLVLTHLYPPVERTDIVSDVRKHFSGPVVIAHDGWGTDVE